MVPTNASVNKSFKIVAARDGRMACKVNRRATNVHSQAFADASFVGVSSIPNRVCCGSCSIKRVYAGATAAAAKF